MVFYVFYYYNYNYLPRRITMVLNRVGFASMMLATAAFAESVVLIAPEPSAEGTDLAVVWIQGANYSAGQYT